MGLPASPQCKEGWHEASTSLGAIVWVISQIPLGLRLAPALAPLGVEAYAKPCSPDKVALLMCGRDPSSEGESGLAHPSPFV